MTLKQLGIRKLGLNDIVRVGDFQLCKGSEFDNQEMVDSFERNHSVHESDFCCGKQICLEEMQNYGNNIYRRLNVKK